MARKVFYVTQGLATGANHHAFSESDPGASTLTTGWTVAKIAASTFAPMIVNADSSSGAFQAAGMPTASVGTTDCFRTPTQLTGTFSVANWVMTFPVIADTGGGDQDGRLRMRMWKAASSTGTSATQITTSTLSTNTAVDISTAAQVPLSLTFSPGSIVLSDEFLFVQLAWEIRGAGGNNNRDVFFRAGASAKVETSDWVAADASCVLSRYRWYADDSTEAAASALAAENTSYTIAKAGAPIVLRVQIQNEAATTGSIQDDYELQYAISSSTYVGVSTNALGIAGYNSSNLTGTASTTARLTAGSGTFNFGEISEDGTITDLKVGASNYTELLFALDIRDVPPNAPVQFRVARNGTALAMRETPQITVVGTRFYLQNTSTLHSLKSGSGAFYLTMDGAVQSSTVVARRAIASVVSGLGIQFEDATETSFVTWASRRMLTSTVFGGPLYTNVWGSQSSAAVSAVVAATFGRFPHNSVTGGTNQEMVHIKDDTELDTTTALNTFSSTLPANASTSVEAGNRIFFRFYAAPFGNLLPNGGSAVVRFAGSAASDGHTFFQIGQVVSTIDTEPTYDIEEWRFYADGTQTGAVALAASTTNASTQASTITQIRFRVRESNGGTGFSTDDWQLQYRFNEGTWTNVSATSQHVVAEAGQLTDGEATSNRIGGAGTYVSGSVDEVDGIAGDIALSASAFTELVYSFRIVSTQVSTHDTVDFRLTYFTFGTHWILTNTPSLPRVVVIDASVGESAVSKDYAGLWHIEERINKSYEGLWNVEERVNKSYESLWNIEERVNKSYDTTWNVEERVNKSYDGLWNIEERINKSYDGLWNVEERINKSYESLWNIVDSRAIVTWAQVILPQGEAFSSPVSKDVAFIWNVEERVNKSYESLWNIQERVNKSYESLWDIQERINKSYDTTWNIEERINKSYDAIWDIPLSAVGRQTETLWNIQERVNKSYDGLWNIQERINKSYDATWNVEERINKSYDSIWNIEERVNKSYDGLWDIQERINKSYDAIWNIQERINKSVDLVWSILASVVDGVVNKDVALFWNVEERVNKSYESLWDIQERINKSYESLWNIQERVNKSYDGLWNIEERINKSYDTTWNIEERVNKSYDSIWNIQERINKSVDLVWSILASVADGVVNKDVALFWNVEERINKSVDTLWDIHERINKSYDGLWNIEERINKSYDTTWNIVAAVGRDNAVLWDIYERINKSVDGLWNIEERVGRNYDWLWSLDSTVGRNIELVWTDEGGAPPTSYVLAAPKRVSASRIRTLRARPRRTI